MTRVLIVGAGNGGFAAAADLTRRGAIVALYNRTAEVLRPVAEQGGIRYSGVLDDGFAPVARLSTRLGDLIDEADLILVCTTASAHEELARVMAPHLKPAQPIILNPGGLLGSVAFSQALRHAGYKDTITIGETGTLAYICRKTTPGSVHISSVLDAVPFAALPGRATADLAAQIRTLLPTLDLQPHVLAAGFANVNAILHPPGMLLAAAWIEHSAGDFCFYYDAATPAVGRLIAALDEERMAVARAWHVSTPSFLDLFARIGSTTWDAAASGDYQRALRESAPNRHIKAPSSLNHRYLHEDIPFGLVPLADLGRAAGVATPIMDSIVAIASIIGQRDYRAGGRTLAALGLAGVSPHGVLQALIEATP